MTDRAPSYGRFSLEPVEVPRVETAHRKIVTAQPAPGAVEVLERLNASEPAWMVYYLLQSMFDSYDAIRYISHRSLRELPGFGEVEFDHMETKRYKPGINQVLNTWLAGERAAPGAALYDSSGRPREGSIQKLMSERDSRPITITE